MALAEFTPVKSPVFGMELVPFSFSHRAVRSKLIAEKNQFETGFRSGVHKTKRIIMVRPLFLDGPQPDSSSMRTSHKTGNSSSPRGSLIQMPKLWKIISNFFWSPASLSNLRSKTKGTDKKSTKNQPKTKDADQFERSWCINLASTTGSSTGSQGRNC